MLEHLDRPIPDLDTLSAADLKTIQDQLAAYEAVLKRRKEAMLAVMLRRFEAAAKQAYKDKGEDTGTVRAGIAGSNLLELKVDVSKDVDWDQQGTLAWLNKQTPVDARHYGKLKVEISETKYKNAPPAVQAELQPLRTVKPGKMKFSLVERNVDAEAA